MHKHYLWAFTALLVTTMVCYTALIISDDWSPVRGVEKVYVFPPDRGIDPHPPENQFMPPEGPDGPSPYPDYRDKGGDAGHDDVWPQGPKVHI